MTLHFFPKWFAPGRMVPNWSPDQHKCQTTWSHSVFSKVFLAIFQMYLSIPTKCISASDQLPDPSDSLARPIIHLIGWFPPGEQHLIVQSWQISADHVCLSSRLQIEFLSFCEISNTFLLPSFLFSLKYCCCTKSLDGQKTFFGIQ